MDEVEKMQQEQLDQDVDADEADADAATQRQGTHFSHVRGQF